MLYTSGSSGLPKTVPLRHRMIVAEAISLSTVAEIDASSVGFNWMPLDHAGLLLGHVALMYAGAEQYIAYTDLVLREPGGWMRWLSDLRATYSWAPNWGFTQALEEVGRLAEIDLRHVHTLINAGEMVNPVSTRRFIETFSRAGLREDAVKPAWGMSETSSASVISTAFRRSPGAGTIRSADELDGSSNEVTEIGIPLPGVAVRIVDSEGHAALESVQGELQIRGDLVFDGYVGQDQAADFDGEWFRTGDIGVITDGRLALTGRAKDIVIINGRNFSCGEVETALSDVEEIVASSTVAAPFSDPVTGREELAVFFVPAAPASDGAASEAVRRRLVTALQIRARALVPVDGAEIPRTAIGKPVRPVLGRRLADGEYPRAISADAGQDSDADAMQDVLSSLWLRASLGPAASRARTVVVSLPGDDLGGEIQRTWPAAEAARPDELARLLDGGAEPGWNLVLPVTSLASAAAAFQMLSTISQENGREASWTIVTRSGGADRGGLMGVVGGLVAGGRRGPGGVSLRHLHVADEADAKQIQTVISASWPAALLRLDQHGPSRRVLRSVAVPAVSVPHLRPGGRYVVTGGLGGIGRRVCRMLQTTGASVLVVGRSRNAPADGGCRYLPS